MKKIIHILLLLLLYPWVLRAQTTKVISLTYHADDFNYTTENGLLHIGSTKYDYYFESDTLKPALPILSVSLLIGPFQTYSSYMQTKTEVLVRENVTLDANPLPVTTDMDVSRLPLPRASYSKDIYPAQNIEYSGTQIVDGYQILTFKVSPFKYDATTKRLYLNTHINITVSLGSMTGEKLAKARGRQNAANGLYGYEMMQDLVVNADELESLYGTYGQIKSRYSSSNEGCDYLIITRDSLKPAFQLLANWKTQKGVRTKILTTGEIMERPDYDANNKPLSFKKAIKEYKEQGVKYLLLGGDKKFVPVQICECVYGNNYTEMPTDLFYSSFGQMDWGNGSINEVNIVNPDIICTRLPVRTVADAEILVQRIIAYEKGERKDSWTNNILMGGTKLVNENEYIVVNDSTAISDSQYHGELIYDTYIAPFLDCNRYRFYDTWTDFPGGKFYDFNRTNIMTELSKGYLIADICTHGFYLGWSTEKQSQYSVQNVNELPFNLWNAQNLSNIGNSIVVTVACLTNGFDLVERSLSEALMCNPNSGLLGYLGCSREGWYYIGLDLLGSHLFNAFFYRELLDSKEKQLGKAVQRAKIKWIQLYSGSINTNSIERWLLFGINPLGDPEMPLFTEYPKSFGNIAISYSDSTLSVNAGLDSCRICVMSNYDIGDTYYQVEDLVSTATFTLPANTYSVCITKPGYIPYRAIVCNDNYIQNESFDCDVYVYSGQLSIGSDVTTAKSNGPVIIENGKTEIRATDSIYIKNDFEVLPGAELSVETNH